MPRFDVLVAGGGSAGIAAAVSAARRGAKTLLVERHGVLGGQASVALVHSICGLYRLAADDTPVLANTGFPAEWAERLLRADAASGPVRLGRVWVLLTRPTAIAAIAGALVHETPELEARLGTSLVAATEDEVRLSDGETIRARAMIDATGDAALATLLGAACEQAPAGRLQRPAYIIGLDGVDSSQLEGDTPLRLAHRIAHAVRDGRLPAGALGASFRAGVAPGEVFITIDLNGGADYEPTSSTCIERQHEAGRDIAASLVDFLREEVSGFVRSRVVAEPAQPGIRESRRVVGRYRIEADDLARGARFDDSVALATWPMELRETARGARMRYPENGEPCEIPLRALRFRDHERCFVAGRCISCSHEAQASLRVIGTCLATGEAAGIAAAKLA